jgi:hypothetical protein
MVTEMLAEVGQPVSTVVEFRSTNGVSTPVGSLLTQIWEVGPSSKQRCQLETAVSAASYGYSGASKLRMNNPDECFGTAPIATYLQARVFFKPEGASKEVQCMMSAAVPFAWSGPKELAPPAPPPSAAVDPRPVVLVDLKDALRFPNGTVDDAPAPIRIFARVPARFIAQGALTPQAKEKLLAQLYGGPNWQKGNEDGSRYLVKSFSSRVLTPAEVTAPLWANATSQNTWFYEAKVDGSFDKRGPAFGPPPPIPPPVGHIDQH